MSGSKAKMLIAGAVLALGAAGCSSAGTTQGGGNSPLHAVETAYTTTLNAKTADVTFSESVHATSTSGSNESETVTGSGQLDLTSNAFNLHVNAPSGGSDEVLETGGVLYIQVPAAQESSVPGNKPWESIDLNQVDEAKLGKSFSQLSSLNSEDPTQALSNLSAVSDNVTAIGPATVAGVATTEYKAEVDLAKVAAQAQTREGAKAAGAITQEQQALGTSPIPVSVWIDSTGLVRQVSEQIPIPAASTGASNGNGTATVTMSFSGFGTPVQLAPPPAPQVADVTAQAVQQANATSPG
jgi:hypothetical protein